MSYWQLFYHVVWSTKNREPIIPTEKESVVHKLIVRHATSLGGTVFAIGGVQNHVHLVVSIPPSVAIAYFIGQIKGASPDKQFDPDTGERKGNGRGSALRKRTRKYLFA